jgi:hypothetical protein
VKLAVFNLFFGGLSFLEGYILGNRMRDVKEIILKDGKSLCIKTFQEGEDNVKEFDVKNLRVIMKDEKLITFLDVDDARNLKFKFYFLEPSAGTVNNFEVFNIVFLDQRYLKY